ncbi:type I-E CRISPR-associated protein Cse2/CasB [Pseudoalteromonas sp. S16_S37]|uniref:type I-E CRISPR-associated protein Cse2/CasB n=1 Tax=Pseudoalteromonas sp. S16_S37 TaxID=2720228 RepID=UPI0016815C0A|nr:type I-E CRISPR-associated protein Cse2/CasB [Pseudoalteromonas sp. S16_S37]MBD1581972.1 type I-E CRISPR-associated protein Cse2/CasB [Pseudoalteromonas sp. S16_S37]
MKLEYKPQSQLFKSVSWDAFHTLFRWWIAMSDDEVTQAELNIRPAPTVFRAQLKRAARLDDVYLTQGFSALWQALPSEIHANRKPWLMPCFAVIAKSLSLVRSHHEHGSFARDLGHLEEGTDKPVVSELRFQNLQAAKNEQEFVTQLSRLLAQLKHKTNILSLADDIACWFEEHYHQAPRRADKRIAVRWAMDYYKDAASKA